MKGREEGILFGTCVRMQAGTGIRRISRGIILSNRFGTVPRVGMIQSVVQSDLLAAEPRKKEKGKGTRE